MSKKLLYVLLGLGSFVIYYQGIRPLYFGEGEIWQPAAGIQSLRDLNAEYDQTIQEAETLKAQADSLKADYTAIPENQVKEMQVMVPDSVDKVRLLSEMSKVLTSQGFSSQSLSITEEAGGTDGKGAYSVSFNVKTTYPRFKELIETFEKSMRLLSVRTVSFTAPEKEGDLISYDVKFITYYLK